MKKIIFTTVLILGCMLFTQAQEIASNAIGIRTGDNNGFGVEISYQKSLGDINRLELDLGFRNNNNYDAWKLSGIYQWVWNLDGNFNWYAGVGAGVGNRDYQNRDVDEGFFLNADGNVGIEYNFDIPLLISLDFRPEFGVIGDFGTSDNDIDLDIALGLRYQF